MSESEPTETAWTAGEARRDGARWSTAEFSSRVIELPRPSAPRKSVPSVVSFDRHELREIFGLYGRKVAEGEWRDYAIDFNRDKAVFSIYRRTCEVPLYRIEKDPRLARRQGSYAVVSPTGHILKRGADLKRVIAVLETPVRLVMT